MNRENFRKIVKECIVEVHQETSNQRKTLKESLRGLVGEVLKEIASVNTPEPTDDEKEKVSKGYAKDGNERVDKTNNKQAEELESIVKGIDPSWEAYWDDHGQLIVRAQNLLYVRIVPKFENNYDIDAYVRLVDRIRAIAVTWEQVKKFVKANFSDLKSKTKADLAHDKAIDNEKGDKKNDGKAAGPDHDKITPRFVSADDHKLKDTPRSDKNFTEPQVKKAEDQPDQPMKQVTEPGKDPKSLNKDIEKTTKVKPQKQDKSPTDLKNGDKKTPKFRARKS